MNTEELGERDRETVRELGLLTSKPVLFVANTGEDDPRGEGPLVAALRKAKGADRVIPVSVRIEEEISELPPRSRSRSSWRWVSRRPRSAWS